MNSGDRLKTEYLPYLKDITKELTGLNPEDYIGALCGISDSCLKEGKCLRAVALLAAAGSPDYPAIVLGIDLSHAIDKCRLINKEFRQRNI